MNINTNLGSMLPLNCDLDKIAVIDLSKGAHSYSFKDIDQKSNAVARGLLSKNIKLGDRIAILSDNSAELISTFFGSMRAGIIPVLINTKITDVQIEKILIDTESKLLFTDQQKTFNINTVNFENDFNNFLDSGDFKIYEPTDTDISFIMYTSGSGGDPKGSILTHRGYLWTINRSVEYDKQWSSKRISMISAPLYHANGLSTFCGSFSGGATVVLLPKFNSLKCIDAIEKYRINTIFCVPTMIAMMVQEDCIKISDLTSVRHIKSASSHFGKHLSESVKQYFPNATVLNSYGITEVGPGLFGPHPDGLPRPINSVGYPANGIEYRIVDGILQIKSPSTMSSYLNQDKNFLTNDGFFITGDLFEIDEQGFYYCLGRNDEMFKCGGYRVYPSHVESILNSHTDVLQSCVVSVDDDIKGAKPYAFVILKKDQYISEESLKLYSIANGPAYQHPRKIWFLKEFPLTGSNKIDKKELVRQAIEQLATEK